MKIFNQDKTRELEKEFLDFKKGYLKSDKLIIAHHDATIGKSAEDIANALMAQGYVCNLRADGNWYVQVRVYENGFGDEEIIYPIVACEAYDEYEDIQVYIPYTEEELKKIADEKRYADLKTELTKAMEDIGQEQLGIVRDDYAIKKARAAEIINELRVLEGKEPRIVNIELGGD